MAKCDEGYLCEVCGQDVAEISQSDLYLRYVVGNLEEALSRWDGESDEPEELLRAWELDDLQISALAFDREGLLIGTTDGVVHQYRQAWGSGYWEPARGTRGHPDTVTSIATLELAAQKVIVSADSSGMVMIASSLDDRDQLKVRVPARVVDVSAGFLDGGQIIAAATGDEVHVWLTEPTITLLASIPVGAEITGLVVDEEGHIVVGSPRGIMRLAIRGPDFNQVADPGDQSHSPT